MPLCETALAKRPNRRRYSTGKPLVHRCLGSRVLCPAEVTCVDRRPYRFPRARPHQHLCNHTKALGSGGISPENPALFGPRTTPPHNRPRAGILQITPRRLRGLRLCRFLRRCGRSSRSGLGSRRRLHGRTGSGFWSSGRGRFRGSRDRRGLSRRCLSRRCLNRWCLSRGFSRGNGSFCSRGLRSLRSRHLFCRGARPLLRFLLASGKGHRQHHRCYCQENDQFLAHLPFLSVPVLPPACPHLHLRS